MHSPDLRILSRGLLLATIAALAGCGDGQVDTPATPPSKPDRGNAGQFVAKRSGASLAFTTMRQDFGIVDDTKPIIAEFSFVNEGAEELVIKKIKPTCGCTTVELDKMSYAPGEGAVLRAEWVPGGAGRQSKAIDITTNGDPAMVRLLLDADIRPFLRLSDLKPDFGIVAYKEEHTLTVGLDCDDPGAEIISVDARHEHLTARVLPDSGGDGSFPWVLELTISDQAKQGQFLGGVTLRIRGTAGDGEAIDHERKLVTRAQIYGAVRAEPSDFLVGRVPPNGKIQSTVHLIHVRGEDIAILNTTVTAPDLPDLEVRAAAVTVDGKTTLDLILEGDVGDFVGLIRGGVRVWTEAAAEPLEFRIMGIVKKDGEK